MKRIRKKIDSFLSWTLIIIMSIMVLNVLWQVFSRYVLGNPSSFTDELARYLMIWLGVLGAAYVSGLNKHVSIDLLPKKCKESTQRKLKKLVLWIILLFSLFGLVVGGINLVYVTYVLEQHSPALRLPLAYVYLVIPLSGCIIIYYKATDLLSIK